MATAAIMVGMAVMSAAQKNEDAKFEQGQAEIAAQQQDLQVTQREADRKDRLATAMASQNAMAGASGISAFEGSPLTVLEDSMTRERTATQRDKFTTGMSSLAIRQTARARRLSQQRNAALTLTQTTASAGGF